MTCPRHCERPLRRYAAERSNPINVGQIASIAILLYNLRNYAELKLPSSQDPAPAPEPFAPQVRSSRLHRTFTALHYPNYRLWFIGQLVSLFGTWMQTTAVGFLIFELTRSPIYLGYAGFAAGAPSWIFTLYGGVIADRLSRRYLLIITQTAMMVLAFILTFLTFAHIVQPWHILFLAFLLGIANAFDAPARQAFASELVNRDDLTNAIALNSTMFQLATVIGPAAAGIAYATLGPGWCFAINGISFLAVIVALALMRNLPPPVAQHHSAGLAAIKEGLFYVANHRVVRTLIVLVATTSLFGLSFTTLVPAWAVNVLGGGPTMNGLLYSARGAGSLLGALLIASLGRFAFRGKLVSAGTFFYPLAFTLFAFMRIVPLSLFALLLVGAGTIMVLNLCNALVQTISPDHLRGRIMGVYTLLFFGSMPLGALWTGFLAQQWGEPVAVWVNAVVCIGVAAAVYRKVPEIRAL